MVAIGCDDIASAPLELQIVLAHQAAQLLAVNCNALVAQGRAHRPIDVALELVTDLTDPG